MQLKLIDSLAEFLKEAVKTENNRLKAKMKDLTDSYSKLAIDEMKKFNASVESIPMVRFVNQKNKILDQANKLSSFDVKKFEDIQNPDYARGELVFQNYEQQRLNAKKF